MTESPKQSSKIEQIDDDVGPEIPAAAMVDASLKAADSNSKLSSSEVANSLESINETSPPVPFNSAKFEDSIAKKRDEIMNQKPANVN